MSCKVDIEDNIYLRYTFINLGSIQPPPLPMIIQFSISQTKPEWRIVSELSDPGRNPVSLHCIINHDQLRV